MNEVVDNDILQEEDNQLLIWKLKIPAGVKKFYGMFVEIAYLQDSGYNINVYLSL
jgi:hypothetical protein